MTNRRVEGKMFWFFLVVASMALMAAANLVDRIALSTVFKNGLAYAFYVGVVNALGSLVLLCVFPFNGAAGDAAIAFAAGCFMGVASLLWARALSQGEATRLVPLFNVFPLATFGFAAFFLGEKLGALQIAGVFAVVTGAILITLKRNPFLKNNALPVFEKGAAVMLFGAIAWGASEATQKAALANVSFWNVWGIAGVGLFAVTSTALANREARTEVFRTLKNRAFAIPSLNECGYFAGNVMLTAAYSLTLVSVASAAETIKLVFVFIFAAIASRFLPKRFKEDLRGRVLAVKLAATALIALGVYLVAF